MAVSLKLDLRVRSSFVLQMHAAKSCAHLIQKHCFKVCDVKSFWQIKESPLAGLCRKKIRRIWLLNEAEFSHLCIYEDKL